MSSRVSVTSLLALALSTAALGGGCSPPAVAARPVATEALPPPPPPARARLRLRLGEAGTIRGALATIAIDDPSLVRVFEEDGAFVVVGKRLGSSVVRVASPDGDSRAIDLEIVAGEPATRALGVGESVVLSVRDVKEYSVGLPEVVLTSMTADGTKLVVSGRKPGRTSIVLFDKEGNLRTHELLVLGGRR